MKRPIRRMAAEELRIMQIAWIASATEILADNLHGSTKPDVDAAIEHAVDLFANQGEQPAAAITKGIQHAQGRILHRDALMLCAVLMINFYLYQ